ncbi:penicillin-binding protein 2 [Polyangium mundeleinium]|uniref:Penicillin-binding protein 2 n=1 Tax=Polyangium mundeleinium TaxID=2995306 RepID=A0ABT5EX54_9BACT|nr:penicillin-binding protein 2 [Polyangium mundeleinium]MDC0745882.1 penicillin-binding protein 2 [Polyangium mundeleinium]
MSLVVQRSDVSEFRRRFRWIALAMVVLQLILIGRLFLLQIIEGDDNKAIARENIVRRVTLATTRGLIRDRSGKILAASRPSYNLYVVPERIDMQVVWPKLVEYLGVGVDERARLEALLTTLRASDGPRKSQQILLKEDISRDAVATLRTHDAELPAVDVVPVPVRYYPYEEVGAHALGYMVEVDAEKLNQLRSAGYVEGDRVGATGIERAWESYLRGTRGWEKVLVDARGRRRPGGEGIIEDPRRVDPIPGRDLRLTLDADIQRAIEKAMRPELAGGVALIDVRTGRIIGLYSKPSYDPNALSGGSGKQVIRDAFRRLYSDPLKPALDKTISGAYPPGSTFKPFTALAALEKGLIDPRAATNCRGGLTFGKRPFRCTHVHGPVDLHKAIAESCNVYFYRLAAELGVGMDVIAEMGQRFGLGARTGLGVNAEAAGRMPTRAWMTLRNKGQFRLGFGLNAAIGQGATTVTVLQLALAYAALANGGTLYQPQIVRAVETSAGTVVQEFAPRVRRQIDVSPENLSLVQKALYAGVNSEAGTAFKARVLGVDMAGKTGTAQVSHKLARGAEAERVWYFNREHAWFAGYSPSRAPEVAVVVLVEHGGAGGKHAAPVAFEVVRAYNELSRERVTRAGGNNGGSARTQPKPDRGGTP